MVRVGLIIEGRVQGVFYRAYTQKEAQNYQITGYVRNLPNGDVEVIAEGEEKAIKKLIEWCSKGPSYAYVKKVNVKWEEYIGEFNHFSISY
jgi:acylphosphatase